MTRVWCRRVSTLVAKLAGPSAYVGMICIVGDYEFDVGLEKGTQVAEVVPASMRTQVCQKCGRIDTDALVDDGSFEICNSCCAPLVLDPEACKSWGAGEEFVCVLS